MKKPGTGINPLHLEPFYIMFGPGAGVSVIVDRETRRAIPPGEPLLLLRATNPAAIRAAAVYAEALASSDPARATEVRRHLEYMANYLRAARKGQAPGR